MNQIKTASEHHNTTTSRSISRGEIRTQNQYKEIEMKLKESLKRLSIAENEIKRVKMQTVSATKKIEILEEKF